MQQPEMKEYMIVMQYANNGSLLSYLVQNIKKLTWKMKLRCLNIIAINLWDIHNKQLVHCDPPFRARQIARDLVSDIMSALRPKIPDSAPKEYKNHGRRCRDADAYKRPDARDLRTLNTKIDTDDSVWQTIYRNKDIKPLSR